MRRNKNIGKYNIIPNKGFSLVEVLVCIAIIAIVCIPIFKGFEVSSVINNKAHYTQKVTAYAQKEIENAKSLPMEDFAEFKQLMVNRGWKVSDPVVNSSQKSLFPTEFPDNIFAVIMCNKEKVNIGGNEYNLEMKFDPNPYSQKNSLIGTDKKSKANDANVYETANISDIDGMKFPVIAEEMNHYEGGQETGVSAIIYNFYSQMSESEKNGFGSSDEVRLYAIFKSITKNTYVSINGDDDTIKVVCDVSYELNTGIRKIELTYNVYSGTYEMKINRSSEGLFLDWETGGKIYIFAKAYKEYAYKTDDIYEDNILIENNYTGNNPLQIYLVRGYYSDVSKGNANPSEASKYGSNFNHVYLNGNLYSKVPDSSTILSGEVQNGNTEFHTNIKGILNQKSLTKYDMEQTVGIENPKLRCYEVGLTIIEADTGKLVADIVTSKEVK